MGGQEHFYLEPHGSSFWTIDGGNDVHMISSKKNIGEIYNNGGNSLDLSLPILERAMFHSDNVYKISHVRIIGNVCFTNLPSTLLITENWIRRIAAELDKSPEEIKNEVKLPRQSHDFTPTGLFW